MSRLFSFLRNINALNIERAYKRLDTALLRVRAANEDANSVDQEELEAVLADARADADKILACQGEKAWDGMFREVHEYLAKIHMELKEYDTAEEHGRTVLEYDRHEGDYLLKQIDAHKRGERLGDFDPNAVDESEE